MCKLGRRFGASAGGRVPVAPWPDVRRHTPLAADVADAPGLPEWTTSLEGMTDGRQDRIATERAHRDIEGRRERLSQGGRRHEGQHAARVLHARCATVCGRRARVAGPRSQPWRRPGTHGEYRG